MKIVFLLEEFLFLNVLIPLLLLSEVIIFLSKKKRKGVLGTKKGDVCHKFGIYRIWKAKICCLIAI